MLLPPPPPLPLLLLLLLTPHTRYTFEELRSAGCSAGELRAAGCAASSLRAVGFPLPALVAAGYSACHLLLASYTPQQLCAANVPLADVIAALPNANCLLHNGYCYRCAAAAHACQCCTTANCIEQDAAGGMGACELGHR